MRALIDSMAWFTPETDEDKDALTELQIRFTFPNPDYSQAIAMGVATKGIPPEIQLWIETEAGIGFPRTWGLQWAAENDFGIDDRRDEGLRFSDVGVSYADVEEMALTGTLPPKTWEEQTLTFREGQKAAVDVTGAYLWDTVGNGGTLEAACGAGKTVMGVELARRLRTRTVVLVHKNFLAQQWEEAFAKFAPGLRVGRIQRDRCDTAATHDVVICMIQTLLAREFDTSVFNGFGLVIGDEVHRHSASEWAKAVTYFDAKYRLGLTATPKRADGMSVIFLSAFGKICHRMEGKRLQTRLEVREIRDPVEPGSYMIYRWGQRKPNIPKLINVLVANKGRTTRILKDVRGAYEAGRRPLVLSHRLEHVDDMVRALSSGPVDSAEMPDVRKLVGGMTEEQQRYACEGDIVVATYQMAAEGLDVPRLDTVFLTTPQKDVEQAVGRIMREAPDKKQPLIVDYVDRSVGICAGMFKARTKTYAKLGVERREG